MLVSKQNELTIMLTEYFLFSTEKVMIAYNMFDQIHHPFSPLQCLSTHHHFPNPTLCAFLLTQCVHLDLPICAKI